MYSKNDYRSYLEHRLMESDDFLAHYGVKGMKWKHRKNSTMEYDQERGKKLNERYTNNGQWLVRDRSPGSISVDASYRDYERTRRTKSVGTNTNSLKTRAKDKARRIRLKNNAEKSVFDKSVWRKEKPVKKTSKSTNPGSKLNSVMSDIDTKKLRKAAKKAKKKNKRGNTMRLNKRTTVTFNDATIK